MKTPDYGWICTKLNTLHMEDELLSVSGMAPPCHPTWSAICQVQNKPLYTTIYLKLKLMIGQVLQSLNLTAASKGLYQ